MTFENGYFRGFVVLDISPKKFCQLILILGITHFRHK